MNFNFITLILFFPYYSSSHFTPANFCQKRDDNDECTSKKIHIDDFEWKFDTSMFNEQIVPGKAKEKIEIDVNRALYLESNPSTDVNLEIQAITEMQKKLCKKLIHKQPTDISKVDHYDLKQTVNLKVKDWVFLAVVDPGCRLNVKVTNPNFKNRYHLFQRNVATEAMRKDMKKKVGPTLESLGNFIVSQQTEQNEGNVNNETLGFNVFFPFDKMKSISSSTPKQCYHLCQHGRIFEYKLSTNKEFANTFKVSSSCEWMTVMTNDISVKEQAQISFRHSFAILPLELKAFPMDFSSNDDGAEDKRTVTVYFYYETDADKRKHSYMIIANDHGRAIRSKHLRGSSKNVKFIFSDNKCLDRPIGSATGTNWKFEDFEFYKELNLAYLVTHYKEYEAYRYIDGTGEEDKKELSDAETQIKGYPDANTGIKPEDVETEHEIPEIEKTTTPKPIDLNFTLPQDKPPEIAFLSPEEDYAIRQRGVEDKQMEQMKRTAGEAKTYFYWAIAAGFASGSFATFLIANIILFVFKRTVCNFWYKAMYKRYGSDTTMGAGTTMGKTGGGETIGGSTTAGGTTMGGTTAGETGSTTAA